MGRDLVGAICVGLRGAEVSDPWGGGHDCLKVGGKMFAVAGAVLPGGSVEMDGIGTAEMLAAAGVVERAACLRRSWARLPEERPQDEARHRLLACYRTVRAGLPKSVRLGLGPVDGGA